MNVNTFDVENKTDQELLDLEAARQTQSDAIIASLNLTNILSKYGSVHLVGAKGLGVMLAKDIDFSVTADQVSKEKWVELLREIALTPNIRYFTGIDYYNYTADHTYDPGNGDKYSYYISLNKLSDEERKEDWEIQIHYQDASAFDSSRLENLKQKIDTPNKIAILRLKSWADIVNKTLKDKTGNNSKIQSVWIYDAVLEKEITGVEDFYTYLVQENKLAKVQALFASIVYCLK
jgi:hypothetical protein